MGINFSIPDVCQRTGQNVTEAQCAITFNSSGGVGSFGETGRGELAPDTDFAGQGALIAFFVPSALVGFFGLLFAVARAISFVFSCRKRRVNGTADDPLSGGTSSAWLHETFDGLISSAADAQLFLIIAYGAAFYASAGCTMTVYSYLVAIHTILTGLCTSLLAFILIRDFHKKWFSSAVRVALFAVCVAGLFGLKDFQDLDNQGVMGSQIPGQAQNDSLLVLPAVCLLESSLDPLSSLSTTEKSYLSNDGIHRNAYVQSRIILVIFVLVALVKLVFGVTARGRPEDSDKLKDRVCGSNPANMGYLMTTALKAIMWGMCFGLVIWNWVVIFLLRDWMDKSGWLKFDEGSNGKMTNPERDVQSVGQVAPLIALGAIAITLTDALSDLVFGKKEDSNNNPPAQATPQSPAPSPPPSPMIPLQVGVNQRYRNQGYSPIAAPAP